MTDINVGDYVSFTRIIQGKKYQSHRPKHDTATYKTLLEDEKVIEQGGSGLVLKVHKFTKNVNSVKYRTARVDAGPLLGVVTAVLDDAVLVGVQKQFLLAGLESHDAGMYSDQKERA